MRSKDTTLFLYLSCGSVPFFARPILMCLSKKKKWDYALNAIVYLLLAKRKYEVYSKICSDKYRFSLVWIYIQKV